MSETCKFSKRYVCFHQGRIVLFGLLAGIVSVLCLIMTITADDFVPDPMNIIMDACILAVNVTVICWMVNLLRRDQSSLSVYEEWNGDLTIVFYDDIRHSSLIYTIVPGSVSVVHLTPRKIIITGLAERSRPLDGRVLSGPRSTCTIDHGVLISRTETIGLMDHSSVIDELVLPRVFKNEKALLDLLNARKSIAC